MTIYEPNIDEWIYLIKGNHIEHCKEQELALDNNIIPVLERPDVYVDAKRIEKGLSLQKYFPFKLLPWEKYQFAIITGVFLQAPGMEDDIYFHETRDVLGRGAGKNGFIDYLSFYFISPYHGVPGYNVDLIANGEDQAATSITDVGDLIRNSVDQKYKKALNANFKAYAEKVVGKKMNAAFRLNTTSTKNKDSKRTGCIIYDEKHQYVDTKNMNTLHSGLGKMKWSREITITTDGHVRSGVLDDEKEQNKIILSEYNPDNRIFINWFRIENEEEWKDIDKIVKANPSILDPSFSSLRQQIRQEITKMPYTPDYFPEFMAKRCNYPISDPQTAVAEWNDIVECTKEPEFELKPGMSCVGGVDYMKTNDFCSCILTFRKGEKIVNLHHTFICAKSKDLPHIHAPIQKWVKEGICTIVDDVEITPDVPVSWFEEKAKIYNIMMIGIDSYRYTWLNKAFKKIGFDAFDKENKNIYLVRPSDLAKASAMINSAFLHHYISGWDRMMCWYTNNTKKIIDTKGNVSFGKIEPKLRKTDGFMAWGASMCCIDVLPEISDFPDINLNVATY
jgi:phage terminase large subunit-like protein